MKKMQQTRNRWLSLLLVVTLLITMLVPVSAFADDGDGGYIKITLHAGNEAAYFETWDNEIDDYVKTDQIDANWEEGVTFGPYDWGEPNVLEGKTIQFAGWSLSEGGEPIDYEYIPQEGDEFYATWVDTIQITLHVNNESAYLEDWNEDGDREEVQDLTITWTKGDEFEAWYSAPYVKEGESIEFNGWSLEPDGDVIEEGYIPQSGDQLYATWVNTIQITLHVNNEFAYLDVWNEEENREDEVQDLTISLQEGSEFGPYDYGVPTVREGANIAFSGWSLEENGEAIEEGYIPQPGDQLYATWTSTVQITLHVNNESAYLSGDWNEEEDNWEEVQDLTITLQEGDEFGNWSWEPSVREGAKIRFAGWSKTPDGPIIEDEIVPQSGEEFYAIWTDTIEVTLHANNDDAFFVYYEDDDTEYRETYTYELDEDETFSVNSVYGSLEWKQSVEFAGWSLTADGELLAEDFVPTDGLELYALWKKNTPVTLYANHEDAYFEEYNEGELEKVNSTIAWIDPDDSWWYEGFSEPDIDPDSEVGFAGWALEPDGDIVDVSTLDPTQLTELYAQWENTVTVTLYANRDDACFAEWFYNDETDEDEYIEHSEIVVKLVPSIPISTSEGVWDLTYNYDDRSHFAGWALTQEGPVLEDDIYPEEGMKLYAQWMDYYKVTFNAGEHGYFDLDCELNYINVYDKWCAPASIADDFPEVQIYPDTNYEFERWYLDQELTQPLLSNEIEVTGDIELFAGYKAAELDADTVAAANSATAINNLPEVSNLTLSDKAAVEAAKKQYDSLTEAQKANVDSSVKAKLDQAVAKIKQLQDAADKKAADEKAAKEKAAKDQAAKAAYDKSVTAAKALKVTKQKAKAKAKKKATITWKVNKKAAGYQIQYSTNKKFKKGTKTVNVKGAKKKSATLKKLKAGKKYFVRIRPYTTVKNTSGKTEIVYGKWTKTLKLKAKK